jgi:hypothetical protein
MQLQDVTATPISSAMINVSWVELSDICQNGVVTMYEIQYEPLQTFGVLVRNTSIIILAPASMTTLMGLEEYVQYCG